MRTSRKLTNDLVSRMKNAMKKAVSDAPAERRAEMIPGMKYRDERGRMVTVQRVSHLRVTYIREGWHGISEMGRREFEMKFRKVGS